MQAQEAITQQQKNAEQTRCEEYKRVTGKILKDDELFVMFYMDAALVVDPNADTQIVKQIKTENPWESLKEYLYDKSDIYFCPSGSQLSVAIEYMPCPLDENTTMASQFGMYRLSSPEELFKNRGESFRSTKHKAVVYGGLNYDAERKIKEPLLAFNRNRGADGYGELKNAEAEAQYIDSLMRKQNVEVALMSGENGSEKSFYKIPSTKADILHIASHGEYQPNEDNLKSKSLEEWMMSHSALILSGYNTPSSKANDNGRLTAYEISQTDLSHIKLAVLSVCESAKGDIKENEVYGLLKGFKMAGAGTLLLTLDTVNDDITKMLMIRFYENLFRGNDPRSALESAQRYLTRYLVRYDNGKYKDSEEWKKFILVDDLDRNIGQNVTKEEREYFLDDIVGLRELYAMSQFLPDWDKARKHMKENDKFVRFFSYIIPNENQSIQYVALVGDAKSGECTIRPIFKFDDKSKEDYYYLFDDSQFNLLRKFRHTIKDFDPLVWKNISDLIKGADHLYFQTTGILNNMPIEYFPSVIDAYKCYRISSLSALCEKRTQPDKEGHLVLFGGLTYYTEEGYKNTGMIFPYSSDSEVNIIDSVACSAGWKTQLYSTSSGTEQMLRKVVEKGDVTGLYISTHSFAQNECAAQNPQSLYEYLLGHCGLILSKGGDNVKSNYIDNDGEGIMTGYEISNFDLQRINMVGLSAYSGTKGLNESLTGQTSDYTWNLVQAFKRAGVKTILYNIVDQMLEPSLLFLTEFYRSKIEKKMTSWDALKEARRFLIDNEWDEPYFWANFVLLDGLD